MRRGLRVTVGLASALLFVLGVLGAGAFLALRRFDAPGPLPAASAIVVPRGGIDELSHALAAKTVIAHAIELRVAALITRGAGPLHAGELAFPAHASLRQVLAVLRFGKPVQHKLTIPDGLTAAQVALVVERGPALQGAPTLPPEGSVLPDTYLYDRDTERTALLARAEAAMTRALAVAWATRAPGLPITTPQQAVTLASIVEQETARPEERPHVAAVFINRLRLGMKLQSDPTVIYAVSGGLGALDRPLSHADLAVDSPYNTYRHAGLPPTPISMPSLAAIQAVLHPMLSDDLYFVADGTGG
ncbi:MAG: endolytic transglycosylase MltG, partial [Pseudomonadota bacterium]|nr:endolytic transglycosylase MltG [Pseudomonadota bacterium]